MSSGVERGEGLNREVTREFLEHFPGKHVFCLADDKKRTNNLTHLHTGFDLSEDAILGRLADANDNGYGAFFCVNELDRSFAPTRHRITEMLVRLRAVFADDDSHGSLRDDWSIEPSIVVESSHNKFHYYWIIDQGYEFTEAMYEQWGGVQNHICKSYGTDPQARDAVRVLRLPGTDHQKGEPFPVSFFGEGRQYTWKEILQAFPPDFDAVPLESSSESGDGDRSEEGCLSAIREGTDYHGSIMWLLNHWANKGILENETLKEKIMAAMQTAKTKDERWEMRTRPEYIEANVRDAIEFVTKHPLTTEEIGAQFKVAHAAGLPQYPYGWMMKLPEPWPMIFENFSRLPRTLDEILLVPTILGACGYSLRSRYLTVAGRRPNMIFLNLAPSAAYKDVNSSDVIRQLNSAFTRRGALMNPFTQMVCKESSITSDTAFLKTVEDHNGNLFWINTEATRIFQQISAKQRTAPPSVLALSDKLIDVVNGHSIEGKRKANETVRAISDPNIQVIFYAQPDTIMEHIDSSMVSSGLLGRVAVSLSKPKKISKEDYMLFGGAGIEHIDENVDDDFYSFFMSPAFAPEEAKKKRSVFTDSDRAALNHWGRETIHSYRFGDSDMIASVVERVAITAEQLYAIVLGICQTWDAHTGNDIRNSIDAKSLLPIVQYFHESKLYTLGEYVHAKGDEFADLIIETIGKMLTQENKMRTAYSECIRKEQNLIKVSALLNRVKKLPRAHTMIQQGGSLTGRFNATVEALARSGTLFRKEIKGQRGYGADFIGFKGE